MCITFASVDRPTEPLREFPPYRLPQACFMINSVHPYAATYGDALGISYTLRVLDISLPCALSLDSSCRVLVLGRHKSYPQTCIPWIHYRCVSGDRAFCILGMYHLWMMRRIALQASYNQIPRLVCVQYETNSRCFAWRSKNLKNSCTWWDIFTITVELHPL